MKFFRVNQIRSERACLRENLEPKAFEKHIGDFQTKEEAMAAYEATATGMEVDKIIFFIDEENNINEEVVTTY